MTAPQNPLRFKGYEEDILFAEAKHQQESSGKIRVPKRVKATEEVSDEDQGLRTHSAQREILLEKAILLKNPGLVRVATPPRTITFSEHFPTATDEMEAIRNQVDTPVKDQEQDRRVVVPAHKRSLSFGDDSFASRSGTPQLGEATTANDQVLHLRRQLAKLNRRMHLIEVYNGQRQQREKIIYYLGLAYFCLHAVFWMNRN